MSDTKTAKTRKRRKIRVIDCDGIAVREIRPGYFMADLYANGKRERPCFDSLDKAKVWCREKAIEYRNFGLSTFNLTEGERFDARRALDILSGTATLAAFVGGGGYGTLIVRGLALDDVKTILAGAIPAALMALLLHALFELVDRIAVPRGLRLSLRAVPSTGPE